MAEIPDQVDVIVVGSGPTACALVHTLLSNSPPGSISVAILERGPPQEVAAAIPVPFLMATLMEPTAGVHRYVPGRTEDGRDFTVSAGCVLGGGGAVNFMHYSRGGRDDYDAWPEGWRLADLLPAFKSVEDYQDVAGDRAVHGAQGPIPVNNGVNDAKLLAGWIGGAEALGVPVVGDLQDFRTSSGIAQAPKTLHAGTGRRADPYTAFIKPLLQAGSRDLHVLSEALVVRVLFDTEPDPRAVGVEILLGGAGVDGRKKTMRARRQVVLSAGALGTAPLLERSGIGSRSVLSKAGVECKVDLPGVGEHYLDHPTSRIVFKAKPGTPSGHGFAALPSEQQAAVLSAFMNGEPAGRQLGTNSVEVYAKLTPTEKEWNAMPAAAAERLRPIYDGFPTRSAYGLGTMDIGLVRPGEATEPGDYLTVAMIGYHPTSRGSLHITSPSPGAPETFNPAFLSTEEDLALAKWAYRKGEDYARSLPFFDGFADFNRPKTNSDADLSAHLRKDVCSTWHPAGTAAMKPRSQAGVVDTRLNVYGVKNLKVADHSIWPSNISAHPYLTAMAIGVRAGQILTQELSPSKASRL